MFNLPKHIAIIPDGNRRWAKKRGLNPWLGHRAGAKMFSKIAEAAFSQYKIPYLTLWIASYDNLEKRPQREVKYLCDVFQKYFTKAAKEKGIHENQVRISVLGRWEEKFPPSVIKAISNAQDKTKDYDKFFLTFLMAYDGRHEMEAAIQKIVKQARKTAPPLKITPELIKANLWSHFLPSIDLVIRTGTDNSPHWSSGFMMWDVAYTQLYFTNVYFPDFTPEEFQKALKDYSGRKRRLGA